MVALAQWDNPQGMLELSLSRTFVHGNESSIYGTFAPGSENTMGYTTRMYSELCLARAYTERWAVKSF